MKRVIFFAIFVNKMLNGSLSCTKEKPAKDTPPVGKEVFVSRTKFPVFLPKASQGDSLAAFCGFNTRNFQFLRNCEAL